MRVHIARLNLDPPLDGPVETLTRLAEADRVREHFVVEAPEESDLILFSQCHMLSRDWRLSTIREHPLAKTFPSRVMVYDERDRPWCGFPGIYVSMPTRSFEPRFQRAWGYFPSDRITESVHEPDLLFSFIGSPSARCRRPLLELRHPDAAIEEVRGFTFYDPGSLDFDARRKRFHEIMRRSRFVLCPRGRGTSSIRLYETLASGRVPVIISDQWVPPSGPAWDTFSIRWPEGRADGLVDMLEERSADWRTMRSAALAAHRDYFGRDVSFHHMVNLCSDLRDSHATGKFPRGGIRNTAFLAAGVDVTRWRATSATRRAGKRLLRQIDLAG